MLLPLFTALPRSGLPTDWIVSVSPSGSLSFDNTEIDVLLSSVQLPLSFAAFGGSFTQLTVTLTVAVSVPPLPSSIV